jgi:hypothetical protein
MLYKYHLIIELTMVVRTKKYYKALFRPTSNFKVAASSVIVAIIETLV